MEEKKQRTNLKKEKDSLIEHISFSFIIKTNRIIKMAVGFWNFLFFFLISVFRFYLHWLDFDGNILFPGKKKID